MAVMTLIAALVLAQPQPETTAAAAPPMWIELPTLSAQDYPQAALNLRLSGTATLQCYASAEGAPNGCIVLSEDPSDYGFGQAAIQVVERGRLSPEYVASVEQPATFRLRVPFVLQVTEPVIVVPGVQTGAVTARCHLSEAGQATDCVVLSEAPAGQGLAEQAVSFLQGAPLPPGLAAPSSPGQEFIVRIEFGQPQP